jgi:bifunctional non-homologous end joining protein LigD
LEEYNRKRNFENTIEPEGKWEKPAGRLKFVVQRHLARNDHFDLRLEWDLILCRKIQEVTYHENFSVFLNTVV